MVFVPKQRRKVLFSKMRPQLGPIFHALAEQKECRILEGHPMTDHVHMCIAIWLCQSDLAPFDHLIWPHLTD